MVDDLTFDVTDAPTREDRAVVQRGIDAGNRARHGHEFRELAIFLRDDDGRVRAGLVGETEWGWLHVALLWVEEDLQGQGWGSRLLAEAERVAAERGCDAVRLDTLSTQAPDFYRHRGYEVVGAVQGFPSGHSLVYLTKALVPTRTTEMAPMVNDAGDAAAVVVDDAPADADLAAVEAGLSAYNRRFIGPPDRRPLAYVLRGVDGAVRGGLVGDTSRGWLYVDYLWVADDLRGSGWGSRLLEGGEREAVARGCHRAYLETNDYQAPAFYLRRGYAVVGRIPDFANGHDRIYLTKHLTAADGD